MKWEERLRTERRLSRRLVDKFDELTGEIDRAELEQAISDSDFQGIEDAVGIGNHGWAIASLLAFMGVVLRDVWDQVASQEADSLNLDYNPLDTGDWLQREALTSTRDLVAAARDTLHGILARGLAAGLSNEEIASEIRSHLWVLDRHASALAALYQRMNERGLPEASISSALARAGFAYLTYRAMIIIVSEVTATIRQAKLWIWLSAVSNGTLDPWTLVAWITARDEKVCPICRPLDGQTRPLNNLWSILPPAHTSCRCDIELA